MKEKAFIGVVMVMLSALLLAGGTYAIEPKYGGVVVKDFSLPKNIGYPATMFTAIDLIQSRPAIEPLFRYDKEYNIVPFLAESCQISPDKMTVEISLRKGIKFHDGTPFNAEAAKFNLEAYRNSPRPDLKAVGSIDIIDDYKIRFNMASLDTQILAALCEYPGMMISPTSVKKNGAEWSQTHAVGTGPFVLEKFEPGVSANFVKNKDYWQKGKPYLDGFKAINIRDDLVSLASLTAGDIQISEIRSPDVIRQAMKSGNYNLYSLLARCDGLLFNNKPDSPFKDVKVRQAVAYAIDRETLTKSIRGDTAKAVNQLAAPNTPWYNPEIKGYAYDPEKSLQLLKEAGYPSGFDTILNFVGGSKTTEEEMGAVQAYLARVKINAKLNPLPFPVFLEMRVKGFKGMMPEVLDASTEKEPFKVFEKGLSDMTPIHKNTVDYPPEYLETIRKAQNEPDDEARRKLNQELIRLVSEKYVLHSPLFLIPFPLVADKKIHNVGTEEFWTSQWYPEEMWME